MADFSTIKIKRGITAGIIPVGLTYGELAVNIEDAKLYVGGVTGNTIQIVGSVIPFIGAGGFGIPLATTSLTGVASFNSNDFLVSASGSVSILDSNEEGTVVRTDIAAPTQIFSGLQRFASGISSSYLVSGGGTFDGTLNANLFVGSIIGGTF